MAIVETRAERIEAQSRYYNQDIHRGAFAVPNDLRRRDRSRKEDDPPPARRRGADYTDPVVASPRLP